MDCAPTPKEIPQGMIDHVSRMMNERGICFWVGAKLRHGSFNTCWSEGGIPHPTHFREGMAVRNLMRESATAEDWDSHDYDSNWERCLELVIESRPVERTHAEGGTGEYPSGKG